LLSCRSKVKRYFIAHPPDVYIGIDSPDFNLPIEKELKKKGIKTVHCNSPTIWAWREKRINKIKQCVHLMLVLFPFEKKYYTKVKIPVEYIGHPLADIISLEYDSPVAINHIALLPGSRAGEIKYIAPILLQSALHLLDQYPQLIFNIPLINQKGYDQVKKIIEKKFPALLKKIILSIGNSRAIMQKSDLVILASGTATLEAMLLKRPMIVVYKGSEISFRIAKSLIKIRHISLPNILAGDALVPELIQQKATPENIVSETENYMKSIDKIKILQEKFFNIHQELKCHAAENAANAIAQLMNG
jgi:lipid-A-disaccharide synthase